MLHATERSDVIHHVTLSIALPCASTGATAGAIPSTMPTGHTRTIIFLFYRGFSLQRRFLSDLRMPKPSTWCPRRYFLARLRCTIVSIGMRLCRQIKGQIRYITTGKRENCRRINPEAIDEARQ